MAVEIQLIVWSVNSAGGYNKRKWEWTVQHEYKKMTNLRGISKCVWCFGWTLRAKPEFLEIIMSCIHWDDDQVYGMVLVYFLVILGQEGRDFHGKCNHS
jgi:hypothetical protein